MNWSNSRKRAGIRFVHPDQGAMWTQELPGRIDAPLRKAIEKTWKFFNHELARQIVESKKTKEPHD